MATETFGPFDTLPWADQTNWYRFGPTWAPSGVIDVPAASPSAGSLGLTFSGLTPTITVGRAWARGAGYELSGGSKTLSAIAANTNASLSRRDRLVLRRDLSAKTVSIVAITGTPSSTPTAPAVTQVETGQWDTTLFSFLVPPSSGTTITGIVDERVFIDPDGGTKYRQRAWTFQRTSGNTSDSFTSGSMQSLISGTATAAPQGDYLVNVVMGLSGASATSGNLRLLAAGTNISEDIRADLTTDVRAVNFTTLYTHPGGDLTLTAQFQTGSANGNIFTNGSAINLAFLGAH